MVKIRLQKVGRRKKPSYRVVVADSRAPRDGAFIEVIGHYDPLANPAAIVISQEKALKWLDQGAQPTQTVAGLLVKAGVTHKQIAACLRKPIPPSAHRPPKKKAEEAKPPEKAEAKPAKAAEPKPAEKAEAKPAKAAEVKPAEAKEVKPAEAETAKPPKAKEAKPAEAEAAKPPKAKEAKPPKAEAAKPPKTKEAKPPKAAGGGGKPAKAS